MFDAMPTYDFTGQTVIITGAARGIGRAVSQRFASAGADVFMVDLDRAAVDEAAGEIGARAVVADVSSTADVDGVVASALDETGRIDVLFNNAGLLRDRTLWKTEDEDWDAVVGVSLGGTFRFTRACVPAFRAQRHGRVITVTSYTGVRGNFGQSAYAAAKAGVIGFTKTAAKELARFGVTVNAILPNAQTRMVESIPPQVQEELLKQIPSGRWGDPDEIAGGVLFLASEDAGYVTGVVLPLDGGISM
jgi:3-oxoacyl-[acyl-carrier protein] reductase